MKDIIPQRIRLARQLQRLSMDDLVRRMGDRAVSKMSISKMERGLLRPSQTTLQAIADACCQPLAFFCKPQHDLGQLEYRFREGITERQCSEVKAQADQLLQHYFELQTLEGNRFPFVHPMPTTLLRNYADAEEAALKLRRKWDIGLQPIHSVYELLACYGIHVLELDFGYDNIDGLSTLVNQATPIIIINTRTHTTTERKRFTALHELAHLLFRLRPNDAARHQAYLDSLPTLTYTVTLKRPTEERLCDLFASAMLMPQPCVHRRFGTVRTSINLEEFIATRRLYGNSVASQIHRLHDLRVIDDTLYHHLYEHLIKENKLEKGWGEYPIMEQADRMPMLEERLRMEMEEGTLNRIIANN